jgi:uncharacterized membrane protein YcaP (DUF421 family)
MLMGKKHISDLGIMDFLLLILLSNVMMLDNDKAFIIMAIIIGFLIILQVIMTYVSSKFPTFKYLFDTHPSVIITNGKLDFKEMIKRRYKLDNLLTELHIKGIRRIEDIEYAILEKNDKLTTFGYNKSSDDIPLPIVLDGNIQYVTLRLLKKNDKWLHEVIERENVILSNIFYAFYKQGRIYIIKNE